MNKYHKIKVSSTSRDGLAKQIYAYKQQGGLYSVKYTVEEENHYTAILKIKKEATK